tara:strand:- start:4159 stop:5055 length:897 start_codon:yes stop_codon:yes gene_type:complete
MTKIENRYDFLLAFDVQDGNPNGDPDAGNLPRLDPETGHGLVTDVCLKRKVRNFVDLTQDNRSTHDIFIREKAVLNQLIEDRYAEIGVDLGEEGKGKSKKKSKAKGENVSKGRQAMCEKYFDVRTFGAVMSTGLNAGQVRGPVQLTFSRSVDPIVPLEHSITRMAVATVEEAESQDGDNRTMGRKHTIPYGLYVCRGFISPALAEQTGFGQEDLSLLWKALQGMFEHDRSAARGMMATRKLIVFRHASALGNAPAHKLLESVTFTRKSSERPARHFTDYDVAMPSNVPEGVEVMDMTP